MPHQARHDVLVVDHHDSFAHNVVDLLAQLGAAVRAVRVDRLDPARAVVSGIRGIVLSPGPGRPEAMDPTLDLLRHARDRLPVLGICLGHQILAVAEGGRVVESEHPLHGSATAIHHDGVGLLGGLPRPFLAARYHSLVVDPRRVGDGLVVTARSAEGDVMALRHRVLPREGVQFHPESYLTPVGPRILGAFLRWCGLRPRASRNVRR